MDENSLEYPCKKGHPHNTQRGMERCNLKYADRRVKRDLDRGPPIYKGVKYEPPLVLDMGGISVLMFYSAVRVA